MSGRIPHVRSKGRRNCVYCELWKEMIFSDIAREELASFHTHIDDYSFGHNATIFDMGTSAQAVYCIRGGAVKMVRRAASGSERIVRVLKKGDLAGLEGAFADSHQHAAIAVGEVRACRIPIDVFLAMAEKHAVLQARLFKKSQAALRESETWLAEFVGSTVPMRTRVARLLLLLRDGDGDRIHRFCLDDMAAMIGSTRETISRAIADFTRQGLLLKDADAPRRYFHGDIAALTQISQEDERTAKTRVDDPPSSVRIGTPA